MVVPAEMRNIVRKRMDDASFRGDQAPAADIVAIVFFRLVAHLRICFTSEWCKCFSHSEFGQKGYSSAHYENKLKTLWELLNLRDEHLDTIEIHKTHCIQL